MQRKYRDPGSQPLRGMKDARYGTVMTAKELLAAIGKAPTRQQKRALQREYDKTQRKAK